MRVGLLWIVVGSSLLAACERSPDDVVPGSGGRILLPGTSAAGAGGASGGAAGSSAGEGGVTGEGGAAGESGSPGEGGNSGEGGVAGEAGQSGQAGQSGGGQAGAGQGGDAGTGGAAGTGGGGAGGGAAGNPTAPEDKTATLAHLTSPCDHPLDATFYADAAAPAPWSSGERGTLARCGYDRLVPLGEIKQHLGDAIPVFSGIHRLRIVYWTEDSNGQPIPTSATLFLPEQRLADGPAPLLVLAHGSVGVADKCAPSREDPEGFHKDWRTLAYSLVGQGWVALMPDYPGLGMPGAHGWMLSSEEGHSLLDATRAARKLTKSGFLSAKNTILGHSQGGHAAISAHALHGAYGSGGEISSVVAFAPVWFSQASWGALMTSTAVSLKLNNASALASSVIYFAGHAARLDGEDKVSELFLPEKAADISSFLLGQCWQDITDPAKWPASLQPALAGSPGKGGGELYAQTYVSKVGTCGLTNSCSDPLAATWRARWAKDRPPPDASIPLVVWGGDVDESVVPARLQCGLDRLKAQGAKLSACAAKGADHAGILLAASDWVNAHLRSALLGASPPAACPDYEAEIPVKCAAPPVNSLKPEDP